MSRILPATRLLVSVRDADEARSAWQAGAAIVDIKDPFQGPLGAPSPATAAEIVATLQAFQHSSRRDDPSQPQTRRKTPDQTIVEPYLECHLSVAMGELVDWSPGSPLSHWISQYAAEGQLQYAKIGPAHMQDLPQWSSRWEDWVMSLPEAVLPVAVAYADWKLAAAPDPWAVLEYCPQRCPGVLLDTFTKDGRCLFDHTDDKQLTDWIDRVHRSGRWVALAGSLRLDCLPRAVAMQPRYLAVRGGVCTGGRRGKVHGPRVKQWVSLLDGPARFLPANANRPVIDVRS